MLTYLLESAFCLAVLYLAYHVTLRRETFFQWNRAYLLLAPVVSFLVPALHVELQHAAAKPQAAPVTDALPVLVERVQVGPGLVRETLAAPVWSITLGDLLMVVYGVVAGVLAVRLLVQIIHLVRFITTKLRLTEEEAATPVASFFGFVIWQSRSETDTARRLMWQHEQVHVRQWHSLDVLLIEALIVVQWFNPLLYLYRRSLREVHEFLADAAVVRQCGSRRTYAELLVEQSRKPQLPAAALATTFHSLLKTRLTMLAKQPSRPWRRVKFLLALPLAGALMLLFSFRFIEKLPAVAPLREAVQRAEVYTATLSELTVRAAKIPAAQDLTPILYWGTHECRLQEHPAGGFFGGIRLTTSDLFNVINEAVYLWDGKTLHRDQSFTLGDFRVEGVAKGQPMDHYLNYQLRAKRFAAGVPVGQVWEAQGLQMPDGQAIHFTVHVTADESASTASATTLPAGDSTWQVLLAGKKHLTVPQFWHYLGTLPFFNGKWDNATQRYTLRALSADGVQMTKVSWASAPANATERDVVLGQLKEGALAGLLQPGSIIQLEETDNARGSVFTDQIIINGKAFMPGSATGTTPNAAVVQSFGLQVFPSPGTAQTLLIEAQTSGTAQVNFYRLDGRRVESLTIELTTGQNRVAVPENVEQARGAYVAEVVGAVGKSTITFVVE